MVRSEKGIFDARIGKHSIGKALDDGKEAPDKIVGDVTAMHDCTWVWNIVMPIGGDGDVRVPLPERARLGQAREDDGQDPGGHQLHEECVQDDREGGCEAPHARTNVGYIRNGDLGKEMISRSA